MSQAYVNQLTLDCLVNKDMLNKHFKNKQAKEENKEEVKFYRKRIYALFKEIISGNSPQDLLPDVQYSYNNFLNASIDYFRTIDNNDIIQSQYKEMTLPDEIPCDNLNDISGNVINADKLMMRSIKMDAPTLDKYVIRTRNKTNEQKIIFPIQKNINLNDVEFKNKGLKKNNITNIYEDTNKKETEHK